MRQSHNVERQQSNPRFFLYIYIWNKNKKISTLYFSNRKTYINNIIMMEHMVDIKNSSLDYLKKLRNIDGDLEIARRVVENDTATVNYFLGEFSAPILDYVGKNIMKTSGCLVNDKLHYYMEHSGEYYEFIGAKFENNIPQWNKISLYRAKQNKGESEARLYTYVNVITVRHFIALKQKKDKNKWENLDDMPESMTISILKEYEGFDEISLAEEKEEYKELDIAWAKLPERDQLILTYLVIQDANPLDIFDEMIQYVDTKISPDQFSVKQKQDAMSLMKRRAKKHLCNLIVEQRNQKQK